ncbi:MAG: MBOAT family O-acyltransferase [Bacteroidia bacterium]
MIFSSSLFLLYFLPAFLLIYFLAGSKYKNYVLLVASIVFYSWGAPRFIFVIIFTTFLDFQLVRWMSLSYSPLRRKLFLILSVCMNLSLLFYFKYSNFFIQNFNYLGSPLNLHINTIANLILPIGISFYTFETITYVVDVYRKVHTPLRSFPDYLLYILLFPKLIAGPIVRYHTIAGQLTDRSNSETFDMRLSGFYRFALGLGKKVLIANVIGKYADDLMMTDPAHLGMLSAWAGILGYAFQIYFDFSGYSDMAIGIGNMVGFRLPENFNNPYTSASITEFWRRWHMTLGLWMRNYLYIPLGGNRNGNKYRLYLNLWIVFLASGLWHGASWNFILWGAWHGLFLILEKIFLLKVYERTGKWISVPLTFLVVLTGWVFFRLEHFSQAVHYLQALLGHGQEFINYSFKKDFVTLLAVAALFSFFTLIPGASRWQDKLYSNVHANTGHIVLTVVSLLLFILSLSSITSADFNPFIYFRF